MSQQFNLLLSIDNKEFNKIGDLTIDTDSNDQSKINLNSDDIIQKYRNQDHKFARIKIQNDKHTYLSYIDLIQQFPKRFREQLQVVQNVDDDIVGFNYLYKKIRSTDESSAEVLFKKQGESEEIQFNPGDQKKIEAEKKIKDEQEPSGLTGFFQKYFWYIVIGMGVLMLIQNLDPEKIKDAQAQAQQMQGAQRR